MPARRAPTASRRTPPPLRCLVPLALLAGASLVLPGAAAGQSLLDRTPNISRAWVGLPGALQLDLLHRSDPGEGRPDATPAAFLAWGFGGHSLLGVHYTRDSPLVRDGGDAVEVQGRFAPLANAVGAAFDLGFTAAWHAGAGSMDGEASIGVPLGPARMTGVVRAFSDAWGGDDARWAVGAGGTLRVHEAVALAADVVRPVELRDGEAFGWGAGVQVDLPVAPVTASFHAANTASSTLQGSSMRFGGTRWGVAVSLPLSPAAWDAARGSGTGLGRTGQRDVVAGDTAWIRIVDGGFEPATITVMPGTYVGWRNDHDQVHGVTAADDAWGSPPMAHGESYGRVFTEVGRWEYHCTLHPEETAVVEVVEGG